MRVISKAFENEGQIPKKYTCEGFGLNPPLQILDIPQKARSLVLLSWDSDVPLSAGTNGNWDHWIVFNINPNLCEIKEGVEPDGVHGITTSNTHEYVAPCPPDREHRYFFKIYAIDILLNLTEQATRKEVENAIKNHIIDEAQIIGKYCKAVNK